jgi:hypothetical protein
MKNLRLLAAAAALVSINATAGLLQPIVPMGDEAALRIVAGAHSAFGIAKKNADSGVKSLGGGLGITQNVGNDFNWGIAGVLGAANYKAYLFKDADKDKTGWRADVELMMSYMPELAENVRAGLVINTGWGDQLTSDSRKKKFGDLNVKVGIGVSAAFSSVVTGSIAAQFSYHDIRIGPEGDLKDRSNRYGVDIPVTLWLGLADHVGLFVEANSRFYNLAKNFKQLREEVSLGVSYAI